MSPVLGSNAGWLQEVPAPNPCGTPFVVVANNLADDLLICPSDCKL